MKIINNKTIQFELRDLNSNDIKKLERLTKKYTKNSLDWALELYIGVELDKMQQNNMEGGLKNERR